MFLHFLFPRKVFQVFLSWCFNYVHRNYNLFLIKDAKVPCWGSWKSFCRPHVRFESTMRVIFRHWCNCRDTDYSGSGLNRQCVWYSDTDATVVVQTACDIQTLMQLSWYRLHVIFRHWCNCLIQTTQWFTYTCLIRQVLDTSSLIEVSNCKSPC